MLAAIATTVCLPPAGSGACVPAVSAAGMAASALLLVALLASVVAAGLVLARYHHGTRDIPVLLAHPFQTLVGAGVSSLIGVALLAMFVTRT